jgi:hypothetical protein
VSFQFPGNNQQSLTQAPPDAEWFKDVQLLQSTLRAFLNGHKLPVGFAEQVHKEILNVGIGSSEKAVTVKPVEENVDLGVEVSCSFKSLRDNVAYFFCSVLCF